MASLVATIVVAVSVLLGATFQNRYVARTRKPLPAVAWETIEQVVKGDVTPVPPPATSTLFGEKPHFFTPPSDQEQYRLNGPHVIEHEFIPYPNDPPHTFPAIKARQLFTRRPRVVREVYIAEADSVERRYLRSGSKLRVPFSQLEERFRTVYTSGMKSGIDITINAPPDDELAQWRERFASAPLPTPHDFLSQPL